MRICIFGGGAIIAGHLAGSQVSLSASSRPISPAIRNRSAGGSCHWSGIALDPGRTEPGVIRQVGKGAALPIGKPDSTCSDRLVAPVQAVINR